MRLIVSFLLLFSINQLFAQNYELDKVTIEELSEKACHIDTAAVAAYIFKDEIITYDRFGSFIRETRVKLKIYKKEGYDYANLSEAFYKTSKETLFTDVVTYNLVNGAIVKTKLNKAGEFIEDLNKEVSVKKIMMPDVKEGSIIEYRVVDYENNIYRPVDFYFQQEIPVKSIIVTIEYPDKLFYSTTLSGYLSPSLRKETLPDTYNGRFSKNRETYQLLNVPALRDEGFVNNINNYRSRIRYELAYFKSETDDLKEIASDWGIVIKKIYESENFGAELLKKNYFEKELDEALVNKNSRDERIDAVLNFVKEKVKWNEVYGIKCDKGVKKAYKEKSGNVADINLMLTSMLRYAGIPAYPVLITTRAKLINEFPSVSTHNYVISGVEVNDDIITLDATNKYSQPNILPIRNLNWTARLIKQNGTYIEFDSKPLKHSEEIVNLIGNINPDGKVSGKIRYKYFDYNAFLYRDAFNELNQETYVEKLEKRYNGIEVSDFQVKNSENLSQPITEEYTFTSDNEVEKIGSKIYFSPMLFFAKTENPFKQDSREYPIDFVFPNQERFNISLTIPDGYVMETLPQAKAIALPKNLGNFKYNISSNGNQIQLLYTQDINQAVIGAEYYEALKNFFKEMIIKQTEKIVLKKA